MEISIRRKPFIVGVMGGHAADPVLMEEARQLGACIAKRGCVLLTGGGPGLMAAASEGASRAGGLVMAVLPSERRRPLDGYPNEFVDIPVYTGMSDGRNAINAKTPHLLVALPGGPGTLSEIALALKAATPVIGLRWRLPDIAPPGIFIYADTLEEIFVQIDKMLESYGGMKFL